MQENPISLQTDQVSSPGQIRLVSVTLLVNGVPTPVLVQSTAPGDADGRVYDTETFAARAWFMALWKELRAIRVLLGTAQGIAVAPDQDDLPFSI